MLPRIDKPSGDPDAIRSSATNRTDDSEDTMASIAAASGGGLELDSWGTSLAIAAISPSSTLTTSRTTQSDGGFL